MTELYKEVDRGGFFVYLLVKPCIHGNYAPHTFITYDDGTDVEYDYCMGVNRDE